MKQAIAPALSRGLAALRVLSDGQPRRLEDLSRELEVPKSTLLRLMGVLVDEQLVVRDPSTREYSAVMRIVPTGGGIHDRARLKATMAQLREATGRTAEWYLPSRKGMVLAEREAETQGEVHVLAQIGFVRRWTDELDAVATLGLAFFQQPTNLRSLWTYRPSGHRCALTQDEANVRIRTACHAGVVGDDELNANGVRRSAAVVGLAGRPWGVLAIAEYIGPGGPDERASYRDSLAQEAQKLTMGPWPPAPKKDKEDEPCEC